MAVDRTRFRLGGFGLGLCHGWARAGLRLLAQQVEVDEVVAGWTNGAGVVRRPIPYTVMPDSRSLVASRVKSLSLETMTKPSRFPA